MDMHAAFDQRYRRARGKCVDITTFQGHANLFGSLALLDFRLGTEAPSPETLQRLQQHSGAIGSPTTVVYADSLSLDGILARPSPRARIHRCGRHA